MLQMAVRFDLWIDNETSKKAFIIERSFKCKVLQGGDMKFLQSRIYFETKYVWENSNLIHILGILSDNKYNWLGFS